MMFVKVRGTSERDIFCPPIILLELLQTLTNAQLDCTSATFRSKNVTTFQVAMSASATHRYTLMVR